jgi:hypothetical protein
LTFRCFIGFHFWSRWVDVVRHWEMPALRQRGDEIWQVRECEVCGRKEVRRL